MKAAWTHTALERTARFGRDPFALLIVVLAILGTAHILVRTATYGAAVSPDSVFYLSTALNFLAGEGWRDFTDRPLVLWPPLFPLLLVAFGWVGIEPLAAGRWINAAAFGLIILVAGCWLRSNLRSQWLALVATAILAASLPLSDLASRFLTEPLFVLFTLLALIQLEAFLNRKTDAALYWAAVFAALAALTRYPGVALIGIGVLILLPLARRRHTLVFGAISSLPLLAVLAHNWVVADTLTGQRQGTGQSLSASLSQVADTFREWVVPPNTPDGLTYLLWLAVGMVGVSGVLCATRRRSNDSRRNPQPTNDPEAVRSYFRLKPALLFGVFTVAYLVFMVAVVPLTVGRGIDSRFLLPVYVPLLLTAVFLLDRFLSIKAAGWRVAVRCVMASLVLLGTLAHVGFSTRENLRLTTQAHVAGYKYLSYNTAHWQHSETLNYIRDNQIEGRIYINRGAIAWFWDRTAALKKLRTYRKIPSKRRWAEIEVGAHIVWFERVYEQAYSNRGGLDLDLRALPGIEIVAELADGVVFRVTAAEPFDAERHRTRKQRYVEQLIQQASEQVVRAGWNVYHTGRTLIYRKEPCAPADVSAKFVLHVVPVERADLPADRQQYDFENLDFYFDWLGAWLGDQCIAIVRLPAYAIDRIAIGQWISAEDRTLWKAEFAPSR